MTDVCRLGIGALGRAYRDGSLSPVEVTDAHLARIAGLDPGLHAFVTVTAEAARRRALEAERRFRTGRPRGPLDGVPVGLKDLVETAGVPTRAGSRLFAGHVPERDAPVMSRLLAAGAVPLGKLALYELAGGTTDPKGEPPPAVNPWDPARVPGGSSSGPAVALAAGLCAGAIGTDTGGSVRAPAAYCGVVGLKPTRGLVSRAGVIPLAPSLDHVGPMARSAADAGLLLAAIAPGSRPLAGLEAGVAGLRIGGPVAFVERSPDLDTATRTAYAETLALLRELGARVRDVPLPGARHEFAVYTAIVTYEAYGEYAHAVRGGSAVLGAALHNRFLTGALIGADEYGLAVRGRAAIAEEMRAAMRDLDLLVLPTAPRTAPTWAEEHAAPDWSRPSFRRLFNLTGQPAVSVPAGLSAAGLPVGMQFAGRWFEEATVLAAAHTLAGARAAEDLRPPLTWLPGAASLAANTSQVGSP